MVVSREVSVKIDAVEQIVPKIDAWLSTLGIDADNNIALLLDNLKELPQVQLAQKSISQWNIDNKLFGQSFSNLSTEEVIGIQSEEVLKVVRGLDQLGVGKEGLLAVKELSEPGLYLKQEKAEEFFIECSPVKLLDGSSFASLDELYKRYSPVLIFGLSRLVEGRDWQEKYQGWIGSLKQEDLESRLINIEVIDRNEFPSLEAKMGGRIAKDDRVSGSVLILTSLDEDISHPVFKLYQSFWLNHYIFETHNFGTKLSKIFQESGLKGCHLNLLFSPGMKKNIQSDYYFDLHAIQEMIYWQRSFLHLSEVAKEFSDVFNPKYFGIDKLVKTENLDGDERVIGFHPFNMVTNVFKGEVGTNSTTRRMVKLGFLQKITGMGLDEIEKVLLSNLETGNIGM